MHFKLGKNNWQPRSLYPAFTNHDKQKLKQFITSKPALQRILKRILHTEEEDKYTMKIWEKLISPVG
jgi:hypothetical protein